MSCIGRSEEGRPLRLALHGAPGASLRLLLFAGQHGDEPEGRRALERLETSLTSEAALPADTQLAIVPDLNPDGAHRRQRRNAQGIDLNRDHQLLRAPETRAIHRYVREFRPHLIVDVHAYPPRRRHLLDRGLVYRHDVFLEVPTHPDAVHSLTLDECTKLLAGFEAALSQQGFQAGRYLLVRPGGRIRHGTLDVRDARNGLALRYGVPTLLLEGRRSRRSEGPQRRTRAAAALDAALRHLIAWADASRTRLTAAPVAGSDDVGLRCRWSRGGANVGPLLFEDPENGSPRALEVGTAGIRLRTRVRRLDVVPLPQAYLVPERLGAVLEILARHGFASQRDGRATAVVTLHRLASSPSGSSRGTQTWATAVESRRLDGYRIFPISRETGRALAIHLELRSRFGLARYSELGLRASEGAEFPVLRQETVAPLKGEAA